MKPLLSAALRFLALGTLLLPFCLAAVAASPTESTSPQPDWQLVRSLPGADGGVTHYVVIPESRQRDEAYYRRVADQVCGSARKAFVFFWTDRAHVPISEWMPVRDMRVMTAHYERHPNYQQPHLNLASWLYPTREAGERAGCFYAP